MTYNNSTLVGNLYTNGALIATQTFPNTTYLLAALEAQAARPKTCWETTCMVISSFQGTIYEFRIWNGVVSPLYLAVSAVAGPV